MRRILVPVLAVLTLVLVAPPALATGPARVACTVTDPRVVGLSGLLVTATGYVSVSDSNVDKDAIRVWFFDRSCHVTRSIRYPTPAYDPEDVALGRDGTIYVADIGDNDATRASIAVWRIPPGSSRPRVYRYRYPDHAHDAEAMLLAGDEEPIFVTKAIGGGEIYVPAGPADPSGTPVPLRHAGTFHPRATGTPNPFGLAGALVVTGGANSPDRREVALRTYADAYVWTVAGGDVLTALTSGTPRVVPLPDEPQGEGIAFDATAAHLFTISDREASQGHTQIREYALPARPATPPASAAPSRSAAASPSHVPAAVHGLRSGPVLAVSVAAVAGAVLLAAAFAVRRRR